VNRGFGKEKKKVRFFSLGRSEFLEERKCSRVNTKESFYGVSGDRFRVRDLCATINEGTETTALLSAQYSSLVRGRA